ncbi:DNA-nicking Smr family endonuclease [Polymorphobacter multimanifer]|uniref:DNA-nicking Smr family endonuclease n=1 Tax=Polymorphobacter multimanifer TaxID=1070431 RepID=A0A841LF21_9SPHN|nr:Smr/MutS family protein [Polymorphobacter multimanifer]MBB6227568.1 DNA-nicking Smr family endonuclease [Polymorphobacter multimanifer]
MTRRLSAHERALWHRVAASVRPLPGTAPIIAPPAPPMPRPTAAPLPAAPPKPFKAPPRPVLAATLDGSWDRKLIRGRLVPDRVIDLHDHSLERANQVLNFAVEAAAEAGDRVLLVITGKGRADRPGRIRNELHHWLDSAHFRHRIAALRPASPRHGGSGAFYLILRRPR